MSTIRTRVFRSNRTQAVRLPKAVELPAGVEEVEIVAIGDARLITPVGESWDVWFDGPEVSPDFMLERGQPGDQERDENWVVSRGG